MKILVMSDSHSNVKPMIAAATLEKPDLIIHLGDYVDDCRALLKAFPNIPIRNVVGNGDFSMKIPPTEEFTVEGKRFFITHGHKYMVKQDYDLLIAAAKKQNAEIVLFGHTHFPHHDITASFSLINPGSIGMFKGSYALIDIKNGDFTSEIKYI